MAQKDDKPTKNKPPRFCWSVLDRETCLDVHWDALGDPNSDAKVTAKGEDCLHFATDDNGEDIYLTVGEWENLKRLVDELIAEHS